MQTKKKQTKNKIAIIGTVGIPSNYGGFETLTEYLTKYLNENFDITVFCSAKTYYRKIFFYNGARLKYLNLNANGIQSIPYDIISIFKGIRFADTLLILGISGCIALPLIKLITHRKMVVNIDGIEWKRDKWKRPVKMFLKLSEKIAVKYADMVVTDNKAIMDYVENEYCKKSKLIAYGADHVSHEKLTHEITNKYHFLNDKYAFTVCRIEPENNIHTILESFKELKILNLVIIGNWSNSEYGKSLFAKYSKEENIYLLDPIYDQKLLNQFRSNCYIYIHGHSAGGTNPSLVEAMYLGLPIFAFDVIYNKETTRYQAKYFADKTELLYLLNKTKESDLQLIGNNMKKIAGAEYTWKKIASQYSQLF